MAKAIIADSAVHPDLILLMTMLAGPNGRGSAALFRTRTEA